MLKTRLRTLLRHAAIGTIGLAAGWNASALNAQTMKPNVVVLVLDQLQADQLHGYGNPRFTSPNIDSLANRGTLLRVSGGSCFAGVARGSIAWKGETLCSGPASRYVLAFADGSGDLSTVRRLLAKTEAPGELRIPVRAGSPTSIKLVDLAPGNQLELAPLQYRVNGKSIVIPVRLNMQAYWVRIDW